MFSFDHQTGQRLVETMGRRSEATSEATAVESASGDTRKGWGSVEKDRT